MSPNPRSAVAGDGQRTSTTLRIAIESNDGDLLTTMSGVCDQRPRLEMTALAEADVCIWDLPPEDARLGEVSAQLPVLVLLADVGSAEAGGAQTALDAGARGVLLREQLGESEMLSALMSVRAGLTVVDTALVDTALAQTLFPTSRLSPPQPSPPDDVAPFTAREEQVAALLVEGLSNKRIARKLDISEHTAKFHVNRILEKLDADTRTEAVVRALRYGMLSL